MIRTRVRCVAIVLCVALLAAGSPTRADDLQSTIANYVAWRGGSAFEAMQSFHESGKTRLGDFHGDFEEWMARNGRLRRNSTLGPIATAEAATPDCDWMTNTSGQIEGMGDSGESDRHIISLAFADAVERHGGATYALLDSERRERRDWNVVRVGFGDADTYDLFIAADTGELLGERITEDRQTRFVRYADWRVVSDVRMPFEEHITSSNAANDEDTHADAIEINAPVSADLFVRPPTPRTWAFASGQHSTGWIDLTLFNDEQIFIPATINGRAVNLLLDSGAGITMLDSGFARNIGVKLRGVMGVAGVGGQATMQLAPDLQIRLGSLTLRHITAGVVDLEALGQQDLHPIPLILGKEVFNQLIIDIDFRHRKIAFRDPEGFSSPPGAQRVALGQHEGLRSVLVSVEDRAPLPFDFDLGAASPLIVYSSYRDSAHLLDGRLQSFEMSGGVGGVTKSKIATLASITIAGVRIADIPTDFPDAADNAFNSNRTAGNIGLPVFSRFRLIADYPHDALWLIPDAKAVAEPFYKDRSGLVGEPVGHHLKVLMVAPGSPAERAGWKQGAEIVAVKIVTRDGNKNGPSYNESPLSFWANKKPGTIVALTLTDGSTRQITLADYY